jgi:PAS domain S-box-containing protein
MAKLMPELDNVMMKETPRTGSSAWMGENTPEAGDIRLKTILNTIQTGIAIIDAETHGIMDANQAALAMFGRSKQELAGRSCHGLICPAEIGQCPVSDQDLCMAGSEREALTSEGERFPVLKTVSSAFLDGRICLIESFVNISDRKKAEALLKTSLAEKDVLLREIYHRVKNNLQVISSLLNLQTDSIADASVRAVFAETRDRVRSMSLVHEKLYQSDDLTTIDFGEYLEKLCSYLLRSYGRDSGTIKLKLDVVGISLGIDTVIPCGLIVNELVSNALKHAFPGGRRGNIWITMSREEGCRYILTAGNDGVFFPTEKAISCGNTLGLQLVEMLVKQLSGNMALSRERGAEFTIRFSDIKHGKYEAVKKEDASVCGA